MKYWYLKGEDLLGPVEPWEILRDKDFTEDTLVCPEPSCEDQDSWKPASEYAIDFGPLEFESKSAFVVPADELAPLPSYEPETPPSPVPAPVHEVKKEPEYEIPSSVVSQEPVLSEEETQPFGPSSVESQRFETQVRPQDEIASKTRIFIRSEITNPKELTQKEKKELDPKNIVLRLMGTVPSRVLNVPSTSHLQGMSKPSQPKREEAKKPDSSEGTLFTPRNKNKAAVVVTPEKELITEVRSIQKEETETDLIKKEIIKDVFEDHKPDVPVPTLLDTEGVLVEGGGQEVKTEADTETSSGKDKLTITMETDDAEASDKNADAFPIYMPNEEEKEKEEGEVPHIFDKSASGDRIFAVLGSRRVGPQETFEDRDDDDDSPQTKENKDSSSAQEPEGEVKKVPSTLNSIPTINGKIINSFEGRFTSAKPKNDVIYIMVVVMALIMGSALFMTFMKTDSQPKNKYSPVKIQQEFADKQREENLQGPQTVTPSSATVPAAAVVSTAPAPILLEGALVPAAAPEVAATPLSPEDEEINRRSAQNIVKGLNLENQNTSLVAYLNKKYQDYDTEWRSDLLYKDRYTVEFVARKIRTEPVQYIFFVDLTDEKVEGGNTISRSLLAQTQK